MDLDRMGARSVDRLQSALERSKTTTLPRFLYSLGIPDVGEATALTLAHHFGSLDDLLGADEERLRQIQDIGPIVASSVRAFFQEEHNRQVIRTLLSTGVHWPDIARKPEHSVLAEKTFVITETLSSMSRQQAKERLRGLGAHIAGSVSRETDFVIVGTDAGSKATRADELGIAVLTETDVLSMLRQQEQSNV